MRKQLQRRRDPSRLDPALQKEYSRFRARGFSHVDAYRLAVFWGRQVVGGIGDVNFVEYGGGPVFRQLDTADQRELFTENFSVEWVEPPEGDFDKGSARWEVYRYDFSLSDAESWLDWVSWKDVATSTGQSEKGYLKDLRSRNPMKIVMAIWDAAGYYGWHELDQYPLRLTKREIEHRYGERF